ncbi:hypothetical protein SELMODRAFT_403276 [Selaginella moellendorffii]|uniref:Uncharacterized protein n=1 Tax=Selaginella moellendorffii TaxID=88036 RepID=D8QTM9_SELML|nr:hypothetical protein SELMODRAFT_403276 [Selaginella moellendorffii]
MAMILAVRMVVPLSAGQAIRGVNFGPWIGSHRSIIRNWRPTIHWDTFGAAGYHFRLGSTGTVGDVKVVIQDEYYHLEYLWYGGMAVECQIRLVYQQGPDSQQKAPLVY